MQLLGRIQRLISRPLVLHAVRPLGLWPHLRLTVGECLVRAMHSCLVWKGKLPLAQYLWPQQVAVGVLAGLSATIYGLRLLMEVQADWVLVKFDVGNASNEMSRAEVVVGLRQHLRALVPPIWATLHRHQLRQSTYPQVRW